MKNTETGDQSGGLDRRHGGSTPAHHVGHNVKQGASEETAQSTDDKNAGAFRQTPRSDVEAADTKAENADW